MAITYKDAGVDKEAGYQEVQLIKNFISKTHSPEVLGGIGGFSGLFDLGALNYKNPVLASGTDGVGTKVVLAQMMDKHDTVGEDCVAMCVNDILCQGAKPILFLDYIATGKLVPEKMADIVKGVASGCEKAGASLLGGETAEMPGIYAEDDYDLAGFAVGVVEKDDIITGEDIREGDVLLGLPSSGVHSNGFSLVRKIIFDVKGFSLDDNIEGLNKTLGEELLTPTRIYVKDVLPLIEKYNIKGLAHITGGGLYENLPRVLPEGLGANLDLKDVEVPKIFNLLQEWGNISTDEMLSTFNMGIGMVLVVPEEDATRIVEKFYQEEKIIYNLGKVIKGKLWIKEQKI